MRHPAPGQLSDTLARELRIVCLIIAAAAMSVVMFALIFPPPRWGLVWLASSLDLLAGVGAVGFPAALRWADRERLRITAAGATPHRRPADPVERLAAEHIWSYLPALIVGYEAFQFLYAAIDPGDGLSLTLRLVCGAAAAALGAGFGWAIHRVNAIIAAREQLRDRAAGAG
jgi:hypothetical protein